MEVTTPSRAGSWRRRFAVTAIASLIAGGLVVVAAFVEEFLLRTDPGVRHHQTADAGRLTVPYQP